MGGSITFDDNPSCWLITLPKAIPEVHLYHTSCNTKRIRHKELGKHQQIIIKLMCKWLLCLTPVAMLMFDCVAID